MKPLRNFGAAPRSKYHARKAHCAAGHSHDSRKEARRCDDLHLLQRAGEISGLKQQPRYKFHVEGRAVMLNNGQVAHLTADFEYVENGRTVVEDVKGVIVRDFPLRAALFRTLWPDIELRVTK